MAACCAAAAPSPGQGRKAWSLRSAHRPRPDESDRSKAPRASCLPRDWRGQPTTMKSNISAYDLSKATNKSRRQVAKSERLLSKEGEAVTHFRLFKAVKDKRSLKINPAQTVQIVIVVKQTLARRDMSVVTNVLGMSEHNICPQQRKCLVQDVVHAKDFAPVEQISRINDDFQTRRVHLIQ